MAEYITKDKAKELVCEFCTWAGTSNCEECEHPVDDVPATDVQPVRHGRWENINDLECFMCSCCGDYANQPWGIDGAIMFSYCPNCGAKMDKEMKPDGV